jgi:hypothetical protein
MADGRVPFGATAANTAAKTADNACHGWTALEYRLRSRHYRTVLDGMPKPTEQNRRSLTAAMTAWVSQNHLMSLAVTAHCGEVGASDLGLSLN